MFVLLHVIAQTSCLTLSSVQGPARHACMFKISRGGCKTGRLNASPLAWHAGKGIDTKTAARLKELEAQKAAAVRDEDYDEAKRLKLAIDGLRKLASQLAELEAR